MKIAIIGNGITGVSAALRIRELKPDWDIVMISGESDFHYSRPALMYIYMGHMSYRDTKPYENGFWRDKRIEILRGWVTEIDTKNSRLLLHKKDPVNFDKLLLAVGSKPNKFGWPGQDLKGVQGLYDLMDLRELYENSKGLKHAVITGGGLIGIELAEMLHSRGVHVTFLVREKSYWNRILPNEESSMVNRIIEKEGIDLRLNTELEEITDNGKGRVGGVITKDGQKIECGLVGLTAGVSPQTVLADGAAIKTGRGILVDRGFKTDAENIYCAGDCAEIITGEERNLLQQVWYTGKAQGKAAGEAMCGIPTNYEPATWFNSAKFLDLEYQTYGQVNLSVEGEKNLYWEKPDGLAALRIVHTDDAVIGVNVMGLRYRHKVCEKWIEEKRPLDYVLDNLSEANFDPEFYSLYEKEIAGVFREQVR
ncbi:MAG: NAD(P)/FAD-dependent oxidoreductase [Candidatus Mycalebacterium zealandia]|nr:MAG: NAD(P)/FAD-dependent oxidoreductase [Candidatus Mycalebacterium zealandia]